MPLFLIIPQELELRAGSYKSLTCFVRRIFVEVLDEASSEIFCFLLPLSSVLIGVARIEDSRINTRQSGRNLEVEERNLLRRSGEDVTTEDSVDDTTGVADRDTLAGTVPTGVNQVSLCTNSSAYFVGCNSKNA